MKTIATNYTVGDYCNLLNAKEITVNKEYQRSDKVWPTEARSFLIETVVLDYPIPKLSLHQRADLRSRKTIKEIVDGQQRSMALLDFYNDKFALSTKLATEEIRGKKYSQIPEYFQEKFFSYSLTVDLFTNTSEKEIREVFRRMNSYTIPLNSEERRHSVFQGEFKWYIYDLTKLFDSSLISIGVFTERQISRMADAKLFSDISLALIQGIKTTTASQLDNAYKTYDIEFANKDEFRKAISSSMDFILNLPEIHKTGLMKPQVFYSLILSLIYIFSNKTMIDTKYAIFPLERKIVSRNSYTTNLTTLADAIDNPESAPSELLEFISSTSRTTNEIRRRSIVFQWLTKALTTDNLLR